MPVNNVPGNMSLNRMLQNLNNLFESRNPIIIVTYILELHIQIYA